MTPSRSSTHALTIILSFSTVVLGISVAASELRAGDWPGLLGPMRNGQAIAEQPLAPAWETTPPKLLWRFSVGAGYAGAAIKDGRVYLLDRDSQNERLTAVDLERGRQRWQAVWPASYSSSMDPDSGPRAVPTVADGLVFCYGAGGDLVAVDSDSGKIRWQRPLLKELDADEGYFGAGSSPLVTDGVVVADIGGKLGGIVGLDSQTGKTLWKATDYDASYSSPIALQINGRPTTLVETRLRTVLVDVQSGNVLSEIDFGMRGPTVNAATPLPLGNDQFLLTASYGIGAHLLQIKGGKLVRQWKNTNLLSSQYNSPVLIGNTVVGVDGREDFGDVFLKGIRAGTQDVLWQEPLPGPTHLIAVNDQLLQLVVNGELKLARLSGDGLKQTATFALPQSDAPPGVYRALPALANHILVVRHTQGAARGEFLAYRLP